MQQERSLHPDTTFNLRIFILSQRSDPVNSEGIRVAVHNYWVNHSDDTLVLGVIVEITEDSIIFKSPLRSLRGIKRVLFSEMTTLWRLFLFRVLTRFIFRPEGYRPFFSVTPTIP